MSPIGARNQKRFTSNLSPIWIGILDYTTFSILGITFNFDIDFADSSSARKLTYRAKTLQFTKTPILTLNWPKMLVK